jgi:[NiFe] hydrogenase large subunit
MSYKYDTDIEEESEEEYEEENNYAAILTSVNSISVPEGGRATFNVRLSRPPEKGRARVSIVPSGGNADIDVLIGSELIFKRKDFNQWRTVTLAAARDSDSINAQKTIRLSGKNLISAEVVATEIDEGQSTPVYRILTDNNQVKVTEGGTAKFNIKLSADPGDVVAVTVGRDSGDGDITVVSGLTYYFNSSTWNTYQPVTLAAAEDADTANGQATFALSAAGTETVYVTASEQDTTIVNTPKRVIIDPVSRIEGHLRVEVEVDGGLVTKAFSSATMFRGIENILAGRDPHDAPLITQRLCGVCTYVHQLCSVRAIEDAVNVTITDNARKVRNLMLGVQYLHDHLVHFYHLHGLDWVDITGALAADVSATSELAKSISPDADPVDFGAVKSRLQGLVDTGNLGPFANAYWGHSSYALSPQENLLLAAHYVTALTKQVTAAKMMAILGGKNPHPQSTIVGGVTCGGELSATRLDDFRNYLEETLHFINTVYVPDLKLVAARYKENWIGVGGFNNFMACGEFPQGPDVPASLFMPRGLILNGDIFNVQPLTQELITEHVARSWYAGSTDRHPENGETEPNYTGLDFDSRYSWLKAPRYDGQAMEVGCLARVLVGYGLGKSKFVSAVTKFLDDTGLKEADLLSTLGRTAARAIETVIIGNEMLTWLDELEYNLSTNNKQIYQNYTLSSGTGIGFLEAPRGALGHWINIQNGAISSYQMVVPTTWNLGPRCADGIAGPLEQALVGLPVADPANPVEVLRVIHSYDPCVACGVHVIDRENNETYQIKVQ